LGGPSLTDREGRRRQRTNLRSWGRCNGVEDGDGIEDNDGDTTGGIEAEGGVSDGVGNEDGTVSREAAKALREVASMVRRRGR
jgi:hypothetical protein